MNDCRTNCFRCKACVLCVVVCTRGLDACVYVMCICIYLYIACSAFGVCIYIVYRFMNIITLFRVKRIIQVWDFGLSGASSPLRTCLALVLKSSNVFSKNPSHHLPTQPLASSFSSSPSFYSQYLASSPQHVHPPTYTPRPHKLPHKDSVPILQHLYQSPSRIRLRLLSWLLRLVLVRSL